MAIDVLVLGGVGVEILDQGQALVLGHAADADAVAADEDRLAAIGHGADQRMLDRREGHHSALLRGDLALEPGQLAALPEIVNADEILDPVLHRLRQVVIGGAGVQELGVAPGAGRRGLVAQQQRPLGRHGVEGAVGVEALGALGQALGVGVVGDDMAVGVEVAGGEQLRRHAAGEAGGAGRTAGDLQRPEGATEADLLGVGDLGVPHHQNAVTGHRRLDHLDQLGRRFSGQVRAHQLGGEDRMQRDHVHGGLLVGGPEQ